MARQNWITGKRFPPGIVLLIFLLIYLVFPAGSSTTDAWNYAAEIKYKGDLFYPYHLLYNLFGYIFSYLPARLGFDILGTLKIMNAAFAVLCIWMVQKILFELKSDNTVIVLASCLAGSSYSVMRYATENETYIIPLLTGLVALFFLLRFLKTDNRKYVLSAGLFSSLSVLFHFSYIFWWIAILAGLTVRKRRDGVSRYLLISLIIPVFYLSVIYFVSSEISTQTITGFILDDFLHNSHLGISGKGLLLSTINFIRSFIQVHGYLFNMVKENLLLVIPGIVSAGFFIYAIFGLTETRTKNGFTLFFKIVMAIIILQFIFAVLSFGNAEFMVMIPVLIYILFVMGYSGTEKFMTRLVAGMLVWNLSYGLIPLTLSSHAASDFLCDKSLSQENPVIIAADDQSIISMIYYRTGSKDVKNIYKSPAVLNIMGKDSGELENIIDSALVHGQNIYTDCAGTDPVSRATILEGPTNREFFSNYETEVVFTRKSVTGLKEIIRITGRK